MIGSATHRLVYPKAALWIGIAGMIFCLALAVLVNIYPTGDATFWFTFGLSISLIALSVVASILVVGYFVNWYVIDDTGLDYPRMGFGRDKLKWSEVERAYANEYLQCLILRARDGRKAYVTAGLEGSLSLFDIVMNYVPRRAVDPKLLRLMNGLADP